MEGSAGPRSISYWKSLLGQNCIEVSDYRKIPDIIVELTVRIAKTNVAYEPAKPNVIVDSPVSEPKPIGKRDEEEML
jgi:hypothetical protein